MRILSWLLGKKTEAGESTQPASAGSVVVQAALASDQQEQDKQAPANLEADNLRRWRESGQARAWVEARQGYWNHDDWLALLEGLKRSPFWPMNADAVGLLLEESKREWLQRN